MGEGNILRFPNKKQEATTMKTITLKNAELYGAIQCIQRTSEKGKLGYALAKTLQNMTDAAKVYLTERDKTLIEFGEDQGNGQYRIPQEKVPEFRAAMKEYDELETEFRAYTVSEDLFTSGNLTTAEMFALSWMVDEEE